MQLHPRSNAVDGAMPLVRFERELAVSGIGTLWLGRLVAGSEAGRTVLLRRMPKQLFSAKDCDALKKVAEAYSRVRHPSLVKLLGIVEQDDDIISVSEHLDGVRLCDLMRNSIDRDSPLPATVAVRVVLDAARATLKAHQLAAESGLFPVERLFLAEGVFVAAFGGTLLTETGVLSTIARFAPARAVPDLLAQLAPEELDTSSTYKGSPEVFSLGILLWEALANRHLFSKENVRQAIDDLRTRPIAALDQVERCGMPVPAALAEVVRIATNRHPSQRFAGVSEFVSALEDLPAHFLATEHHVASALRGQAADLLRDFHVDESQSSLTVAFSEVPASRHSTRPPPENAHDWEPPTFAQRKLVSSLKLPLHAVAPLDGIEASPSVSQQPNAPIDTTVRQPQRKLVLGLALALGVLGLSLLLIRTLHTAPKPTVLPDKSAEAARPATTAVDPLPLSPAAAAAAALAVEQVELGVDPNPSAPSTQPTDHATRPKKSSLESSPIPSSSLSATPMPTRKSNTAYHPRQIAPYRPKGI